MKTLIFHTMVAPHIQQDARALLEAGMLHRFHTAFFNDSRSSWQRWSQRVARMVGFDLSRELVKRSLQEIPPEKVSQAPTKELIRLIAGRLDASHRLGDRVWEWSEPAFDRDVSRRCLTPEVDAVFGYEHACEHTFREAGRTGRRRILVIPAPEPGYVEKLLSSEVERFPALRTPLQQQAASREARRRERRQREWDLADVIMVASRFTRESFVQAGRAVDKVEIVPLGAPPPVPVSSLFRPNPADRLILLWAGTFSVRKGAHYVLEAWRQHRLGRFATLQVYGSNGLPDSLVHPVPEGIEFAGAISREELMPKYGRADALLFPTLCDGFGMVATEAWSQGCPVLTTERAGAADLLKPGKNGRLITPGCADAIAEAVTWCHENRDALSAMREPARETAAGHLWQHYRDQVGHVIRTRLQHSGT